jgi:hypothetical protein
MVQYPKGIPRGFDIFSIFPFVHANLATVFYRLAAIFKTFSFVDLQYSLLRDALSQGLNHIPLRPTNISESVAVFVDAFKQLVDILQLATL